MPCECCCERKRTALHIAAEKGHVDVAKVLIQNGADVNAVDQAKQTALHIRSSCGHVDVVESVDSERC